MLWVVILFVVVCLIDQIAITFRATRHCPQCKRELEKLNPESEVTCQCGWVWR